MAGVRLQVLNGRRERGDVFLGFLFLYLAVYKCVYLHGYKSLGPRWLLFQLTEGKAGREDEEVRKEGGRVVRGGGIGARGGGGREGGREERRRKRERRA